MLKAEILLGWLVLMCGQILLWRRRDNIFGYLQAGFFVASIAVPVLGTTIIDNSDPAVVRQYAHLLLIGAAAYLFGLFYGAPLGARQRLPSVTFGWRLDPVPPTLVRRCRQAAVAAIGALALSFVLLGYIPFLTADRVGAKYGVGAYRAGFERAAVVFHLALRLGSTVLPVMLALYVQRRRSIDGVLVALLGLGLAVTLSRGSAFFGPVVFFVGWLVVKRWKPWQIVAVACLVFLSATLVNEIVRISRPVSSTSFATRVAASAPEISDQLGFLNGFNITGNEHVGLRTIISGLSLTKGEYNPSSYALRIRTGLSDVRELASGGLRLPAPIWGYAAYGWAGAAVWSFLSGFAIGFGTSLIRRLLTPVEGRRGQLLSLMLAWVFMQGTFVVLSEFYFPERAELVSFAIAAALTFSWLGFHRPGRAEAPALASEQTAP